MRAATGFFVAWLLPLAALADPPLPVLQQISFLGRWSASCEAPPSPANPYLVYYDAGGGLVGRRLDRGAGLPMLESRIDSAKLLAPGRLALTVRNLDANWKDADGMVFETEVEVSGDRARTVRSVASTGRVYIADGKMADGSRPVPTLTRCRE
jgi:hypothetical protein